jgi:FPC/CPF motif-containing protein YcgG
MQIETLPSHRDAKPLDQVTQWWYTPCVATSHPRIQVTEDPELARALSAAAPHLRPGLPRSQQVRELALVGARHLAEELMTEERREELLDDLVSYFEHPETAPWDWDLLRDVKQRAWRFG